MGNDISSSPSALTKTAARTPIPLDNDVCWQLFNGVNAQAEPISVFVAKQTFSVECRRSIQFLKTLRHPNIIKYFTGFKTFTERDSFIADCVHPLANKLSNNDVDSPGKISLGLYQLSQALEFLHEKASISHNNVCLLSLYISLNGTWKLGNFECACRYENLNRKFLSSLTLIRAKECVTPEENEKSSDDFTTAQIHSFDIYGFGTLIRNLTTIITIDDPLNTLLNDLQIALTDEDPELRPKWSMLLQTQFFQIDYIKITELLDRLPTINESDLSSAVDSLSAYLDNLDAKYFNELLIRRLFLPFMFLCSSTRTKLIPRIIIPKDDDNNSWVSIDKYRTHAVPLIVDLFSYHVTCIRVTLLEYFNSYWQLIDRTMIVNVVLPQLVYGLKDSNNTVCMLTLSALSAMVPVLGADVVLGGQRKQIFTDKLKRENVAYPKTSKLHSRTDSPVPQSPVREISRQISPTTTDKFRPIEVKSTTSITKEKVIDNEESSRSNNISQPHTNGSHLPLNSSLLKSKITVIPNGLSDEYIEGDIDNDNEEWSDWEPNPGLLEPSNDYLQQFTEKLTLFSPTNEQPIQANTTSLPSRSLKLNSTSKSKWDPNAPLGSEYEVPTVVLATKKLVAEASKDQDTEDFFKDMAPKVETVELMQQLETMFNVNKDHPGEKLKSTKTTSSFSGRLGIVSHEEGPNDETANGDNNWDE